MFILTELKSKINLLYYRKIQKLCMVFVTSRGFQGPLRERITIFKNLNIFIPKTHLLYALNILIRR